MKSKNKISKTAHFIGGLLSYLILVVLIALCAFFLFYLADNVIAKKTGRSPSVGLYVIVSPSMVPTINVHDVIIDTAVRKDSELKRDDIVTFYSNVINTGGYTITHRINTILEENGERRYITKGDHNKSVDVGFVTLKDIVGKVRLIIPKIGKIQSILSTKLGWALIVLIPAIGILISDFIKLIDLIRVKKELIDIPDIKKEIEESKKK